MTDTSIFPPKINIGDTVNLIATSSPAYPESIERTKSYLEKKGLKVKLSKNIIKQTGYLAGTAEERADDLNEAIRDPSVNMIISINGGKGAIQLLPHIDYEALLKHPKVIVGLSDVSLILNAIYRKINLVTFHGPTGYDFGHVGLRKYTEDSFWSSVLLNKRAPYKIDTKNAIVAVHKEDVEGILIGGHLGTNIGLIGTQWEPIWDNKILLLEEIFTDISKIESMLYHLELTGALDKISGIIFGQLVECPNLNPVDISFEEMLARIARGRFPILSNVNIGHMRESMTVPIGAKLRMSTGKRTIEILENGVF